MADGPLTNLPTVTAASWPAAREAGVLLRALGAAVTFQAGAGPALVCGGTEVWAEEADAVTDWARSGAMALTGRADGPPLHCVGLPASRARGAALVLELLTSRDRRVVVDGAALLGERAALTGFTRHGATSVGGATRMLRTAQGWWALSLARESDLALVPALLEDTPGDDCWVSVSAWSRVRTGPEVVARAALLGLAAGELTSSPVPVAPWSIRPVPVTPRKARVDRPLVVNLGSLWAAPLCAQLLGKAGAQVVHVESPHRPDGARRGNTAFFDLLHAGHESVAIDPASSTGRAALRDLLRAADVVIEASRPRALRALGLSADAVFPDGGPAVWARITGHGQAANRIGFGDDAAVAGGLVGWDEQGPVFAGDAIADPLTGIHAALAILACLAVPGCWLIDMSLRDVAASVTAPGATEATVRAQAPRARRPSTGAEPLGASTERVLGRLGIVLG
ncbi:MAG TPA: CoA transferase [Pseudonocardiaceae bacterium]|nr:CoA transferase [Pseudonocardiaceae bacterium]